MDTEELSNKLKGWFSKGAKVSKEALEKAGDKVQEFSDKSVIRIEKKQLESKLDNKYKEIGEKVTSLIENKQITFENQEEERAVKSLMDEVCKLKDEIKAKADLL